MHKGSQPRTRAEQKATQKTKEGDPQATSMASQNARGGARNKDGTSRDKIRGSPNDISSERPKTASNRKKPPYTELLRAKSAAPRHSSGSGKGEETVSIDVVEHHTTKRDLENEKLDWKKEKAEWEKKEAEWKKEKADLQSRLEEENNKAKTNETSFAYEMQKLKEENERAFNKSKTEWENYCMELTEKHTKETKQLDKTIKSLTAEKDKLLTRLSTIASNRLTHENVNIADLSDADRPTKLQEGYSELYDNEWTDAFEELTAHEDITENFAIIILLKILMSSFQNCREITWGRYERLKNVASYIEQEISLQSPKVMNNVSEPGLTTQEAESSRAQLDKNDERADQIAANGKVEMEDPSTIKASEEEIENEIGKTSNTDKNVDNMQEQAASRETGENKGMQIVSEKSFFVKDTKDIGESSDPNESEASSKEKFENKTGKKRAKENVQSGDPNKDTKDIGESSDPNESEASSKEKFENKTGKKRAKENVQSGDPNVSEASKDKSENKNGKKGATENVESSDENVSEVSKDKSENKKGKKDAKDNVESSDPNESEASSKDNFENKKGKKRAKENVQSGDPNNSGKQNVESGDPNVIGASKDKSENNGAKENMESGDPNMSEASKDKFEVKTGKHLKCTIDLNFELTHDIKGIWRKTTLELKGIAAEPLCSLIETCLDMPFVTLPKTSKYLKRCIDLCWKMGVQEKPLHLDCFAEMDAYAGKKFDKDKFRSYTRSGSHIDFVVWPTLYMYEGGPILVKGIVQCCSPVEAKLKSLRN